MLKEKNSFDWFSINNIIIIISCILFIISLFYLNNLVLMVIVYLLILYFSTKFYNNYVKFISCILPIVLFGFILFNSIKFNIVRSESYTIFSVVIKILLSIDYLLIIYEYLKEKKEKVLKVKKNKYKKYTFKELRKLNLDKYKKLNMDNIEKYISDNNISSDSDYYKVIMDNYENKSKNDLEEFVWINYLRFYKNKRYIKNNYLDKYSIIYLLVHVIIFLIIIFVR